MGRSKLLIIVLVALLSLAAGASTPANADTLTSESSPITLTNSVETGGFAFVYPSYGTTECESTELKATTATPTTTVSGIALTHSECTTVGLHSTISSSGCTYTIHVGAGTTGTADIVCPAGKKVKIEVFSGATKKCTLEFGTQSGKGTVNYSNVGSGTTREVLAELDLEKNISASAVAGEGIGKCPTGSTSAASFWGFFLLTGETDGGSTHVGVFAS